MLENPMYLATPPEPEPEWMSRYREYANCLPQEAQDALALGTEWEQERNDIGGEDAWASYDDDYEGADGWRQYWYPRHFRVEDEKLYEVVEIVDTDGNWEFSDEAEVGTPEHARMLDDLSYEKFQQTWREYAEWVVENGEDPLGNYFVQSTRKAKQKWQFLYSNSITGPRLVGARRNGRGPWINAAELPEEVLSYLLADKTGKVWEPHMAKEPDAWAYLLGIVENSDIKRYRSSPIQIKGTCEVEVSKSIGSYKRRLVAAARKHLAKTTSAASAGKVA